MPDNHFERIADRYDAASADMFLPSVVDPAVEFLAHLAGDGAALELGVGTGRIALPLSARGVPVHGIELSEAMVQQMHAKAGAGAVGVTIGDFATAQVERTFRVVYLVFNTITNLTTQDEQVACFRNAAAHLEPGGCFVVEVSIPDLQRLPPGETVHPFGITSTHFGFEQYDLAAQIAWSHHFWITDGAVETFSTPHRYVWPAELDLMARLTGLSLLERWADWQRTPFTGESRSHVSVWQRPT